MLSKSSSRTLDLPATIEENLITPDFIVLRILDEMRSSAFCSIATHRAFYEWRNRSGAHCVIYIVLFGAERKAT